MMGAMAAIGKAIDAVTRPFESRPINENRITWHSYNKWRVLSHKGGRVVFRRYAKRPTGIEVKNADEATAKARELWAVDIDSRGRPITPMPPAVIPRAPGPVTTFRPIRPTMPRVSHRMPAITPRFRGLGRG